MAGGKLLDRTGCLLAPEPRQDVVAWGGRADRVLLGGGIFVADSARSTPLGAGPLVLSKPSGTAALRVNGDGRLLKREIDKDDWRDISFLARHKDVVYHPAGAQHRLDGYGRDR